MSYYQIKYEMVIIYYMLESTSQQRYQNEWSNFIFYEYILHQISKIILKHKNIKILKALKLKINQLIIQNQSQKIRYFNILLEIQIIIVLVGKLCLNSHDSQNHIFSQVYTFSYHEKQFLNFINIIYQFIFFLFCLQSINYVAHKNMRTLQNPQHADYLYAYMPNPETKNPRTFVHYNPPFSTSISSQKKQNIHHSNHSSNSQKKFNAGLSNEKRLKASIVSFPASDDVVHFSYKKSGQNYYYASQCDNKVENLQKLENIIVEEIIPKLRLQGSTKIMNSQDSLRLYLSNMQQREKQWALKISRLERQLRNNVKIINSFQKPSKNKQSSKDMENIKQQQKQLISRQDLLKQLKEENYLLQRKNQQLQERKKETDIKISLLKVKYEKAAEQIHLRNQRQYDDTSRHQKTSINSFQRKKTKTFYHHNKFQQNRSRIKESFHKQTVQQLSKVIQQKNNQINQMEQQLIMYKQTSSDVMFLQDIINSLEQQKLQRQAHYNNLKEECNYYKSQCERLQYQIEYMNNQIQQLQAKDRNKVPKDNIVEENKAERKNKVKEVFQKMLKQLDIKIQRLQKQLGNREELIIYAEEVLDFVHGHEVRQMMSLRQKLDLLYTQALKNQNKTRVRRRSQGQSEWINFFKNKNTIKQANLQQDHPNGIIGMIHQDLNELQSSPKKSVQSRQ